MDGVLKGIFRHVHWDYIYTPDGVSEVQVNIWIHLIIDFFIVLCFYDCHCNSNISIG